MTDDISGDTALFTPAGEGASFAAGTGVILAIVSCIVSDRFSMRVAGSPPQYARPQGRVDEKKGKGMRPCVRDGLPTGARPPAYEARWRSPVDKPAPRLELTVIVTDAVRI